MRFTCLWFSWMLLFVMKLSAWRKRSSEWKMSEGERVISLFVSSLVFVASHFFSQIPSSPPHSATDEWWAIRSLTPCPSDFNPSTLLQCLIFLPALLTECGPTAGGSGEAEEEGNGSTSSQRWKEEGLCSCYSCRWVLSATLLQSSKLELEQYLLYPRSVMWCMKSYCVIVQAIRDVYLCMTVHVYWS